MKLLASISRHSIHLVKWENMEYVGTIYGELCNLGIYDGAWQLQICRGKSIIAVIFTDLIQKAD